jgi:small subunit ribosomal protein S4
MKKDNAKTPHQSRQLVVHGHVSIGGRVINIPGYIVKKDEESKIDLRSQFMNPSQNIPTT